MKTVDIAQIQQWSRTVLESVGLDSSEARVVTESLGFAEERGILSHGFLRLSTYVRRIKAGGIQAGAQLRQLSDSGALTIFDAGAAAGAVTADACTRLAISRASEHGIACVIANNANHFGAAAFFTNAIADSGFIGIVACNTDKVMCAPFGGSAVLGTNPLAVAPPLDGGSRPQLDMATTEASYGKLVLAARDRREIPLGWAVDGDGQPTTSAAAGLEGALMPAGGPKGFGLAFAIDLLLMAGGARPSSEVGALYGDPAEPQRLGQLFIALRADAVTDLGAYRDAVAALVAEIHASGPGPGGVSALAPGEPELDYTEHHRGMVYLAEGLLLDLRDVSALSGCPLPDELLSSE
jgi:LDH2 family malate/lactate/ureidoglycolate dehydrogenase